MLFGEYLRELRGRKSLRQTDIAESLGISTVYVCDIEKGRRNPPSSEKLDILVQRMSLTDKEASLLFDLAGRARGSVAPDIIKYLEEHPCAKDAIRRIIAQSIDYNWNNIP